MSKECHKILLSTDGSRQALEAVRYVAALFPPAHTRVVLFNVGSGYPEVFWDMDGNPLYRSKKNGVMRWLADQQLVLGEFKEIAEKIFADAGYPENAVQIRTQPRKTGMLADIVCESYQDYSAMVLGQTGVSRIKDLVVGSLASRLVGKIKHIPLVIVSGCPSPGGILIALDESIEAMRVVSSIADLVGAANPEIILCHALRLPGMFRFSSGHLQPTERELDWLEYRKNKFRPYMDEAVGRLRQCGVAAEKITRDFVAVKGNPIPKIFETARRRNCSTLAVGRHEAVSFAKTHFRSRFSDKILKRLVDMAVWIVS